MIRPASDLNAFATSVSDDPTITLTSLPIEITITIIELLMSPNERMKGLGLIRRSVSSLRLEEDQSLTLNAPQCQ